MNRRKRLAITACAAAAALGGSLLWATLPAGLSLRGAVPLHLTPTQERLGPLLQDAVGRVARSAMADFPPRELAFSWGEGVLCFGLERAYQLGRDPAILAYLRAYLRHHQAQGVRVEWSDDLTPALVAAERVRAGDAEFEPLVAQAVRYAMAAPRTKTGLLVHLGRVELPLVRSLFPEAWVDSAFHAVPTLVRYAEHSGQTRYRDEGARQLLLFLHALQDPNTGLVTHAYNDLPRDERVPAFAQRAFWARGNGWMLASLVDALEHLPASHPSAATLRQGATRLERALRARQTRDGLFRTLLLRDDSYQETAGSGLILYAMARGLRRGLFGPATREAVIRGGRALLGVLRSERDHTVVTGTSLGTNPVEGLYALTPTADQISYGVGAWLMAASEIAEVASGQAASSLQ